MTMYQEVVQKKFGKHLICPACHAFNVENASPTIRVDSAATHAECCSCSFEAVLEKFQPKDATWTR